MATETLNDRRNPIRRKPRVAWFILTAMIFLGTMISFDRVLACPFCSAINLTFSEQLKSNDVVVIAKLLEVPPPSEDPDAELPKAIFEITDIVKGDKWVSAGMTFRTLLVGRYPIGQSFLVMGVDPPSVAWSTPMKASERLVTYLKKLETLPKSGADRLEFFQDYFEDEESVLAFDAYDEFAQAPYEDLIALKDKMKHEQLIAWIKNPETSINRRRLYFTMLGVCGKDDDVALLEEFIESGDRKKQAGLDALIACYLNLKGEAGVSLIEETFIKDKSVDYVDTLSAVSALRFHGTEVEFVPKERIVAAVRHLLDRPKMADMIIPDLARWEDWSVMDRLVQMFKDADEETNWLRVPVITYLRACPKPEAKKHIEELSKIDPDAVRRADFFLDFGDDEFDDEEDTEADTEEDAADNANSDADKEVSETDSNADVDKKDSDGSGTENDSQASMAATLDDNGSFVGTHSVRKVPISEPTNQRDASSVTSIESEEVTFTNATAIPDKSVSAGTGSMADRNDDTPVPVAQNVAPVAPVAVVENSGDWTFAVILIPMAISLAIFVLLWSVINGWFERLIV